MLYHIQPSYHCSNYRVDIKCISYNRPKEAKTFYKLDFLNTLSSYFEGTDKENRYMTKTPKIAKTTKRKNGTNKIIFDIFRFPLYFINREPTIIKPTIPILLKFIIL